MVKLIICAARKAGTTHEEFSVYWREKHGPLVKSVTEFSRHVRKYVQCHLKDTPVPFGIAGPYDGVAELWFDSVESIAANGVRPEAQAAGRLLLEDERKFIDLPKSPLWFGEEKPIVG